MVNWALHIQEHDIAI